MAATAKLLILLCLSGTALSFLPPLALMSMMRGGEMSQRLPLLMIIQKYPHILQDPMGMMLLRIFSRAEYSRFLPLIANKFDVLIKMLQQNPMLMFTLMRNPDAGAKMLLMMSFMGGQGGPGGINPMALMMMNGNGGEMNPMVMMSLMSSMNQGQGATAGEPGAAAGGGMSAMDPMMTSLMMNGGEMSGMGMLAAMASGGTSPMGMGTMAGAAAGGAMA